jgi:hypothetical protein
MSNPDERTAIDQFGTGDKYFGVCTMLATLPGLPMFGHGQIEAFTEKYGMEYKRPRYDETPNHHLVDRHMREIAPLLKNRHVFAESANFALFDFWLDNGSVDENVFAWSNRAGDQRAIAVYHNKYATTSGTLHHSSFRTDKTSGSLYSVQIHEALALPGGDNAILAYQDNATGLHYLQRLSEIRQRGLRLELRAYQYHVFQNWREMVPTADYPWDALCADLNGTGVWSLDEAMAKFRLRPVHQALRAALREDLLRCFSDIIEAEGPDAATSYTRAHQAPCSRAETLAALEKNAERFFLAALAALPNEAQTSTHPEPAGNFEEPTHNGRGAPVSPASSEPALAASSTTTPAEAARSARDRYHALLQAASKIPALESAFPRRWPSDARIVLPSYSPQTTAVLVWTPVVAWCLLRAFIDGLPATRHPAATFDFLYLRAALADAFAPLGLEGEAAYRAAARIRLPLAPFGEQPSAQHPADPPSVAPPAIPWDDPDVAWLTGLHTAQGHRYFNKEAHEQLLWWLALPQLIAIAEKDPSVKSSVTRVSLHTLQGQLEESALAAAQSGYRLDPIVTPTEAPASANT